MELTRNWAKISLKDNSGKLADVQFMVYNASTKATVAPGSEVINLPVENSYQQAETAMTAISSSLYPFEQSTTEGDNRAFVIVKAKYNGSTSYSYYKLDLAVANKSTGVVANYDIIRNYWYKITISQVDRVGVAWSEVIKPGRIADNNITASTELDKYPSIAFGTEKLEVSKTTYVFTKSGQSLNMLATYVNTAPTPENQLDMLG